MPGRWAERCSTALADLAELEQRREAAGAAAKDPPSWTRLIKPYCEADRAGLDQIGKETVANRPWSLMLKYHVVASYFEARWMFDTGQEIDEVYPTAYGVYDSLVTRGEYLGLSRFGAAAGPHRFAENVPVSLAALSDMPATVQSLAANVPRRPRNHGDAFEEDELSEPFSPLPMEAAERLRNESAKVLGDPSWSALAAMLEEEQFLQVAAHFRDAANATESSFVDEVDQLLPLIKRHRYSALIDGYRYRAPRDAAALTKLMGVIKINDPRMNMLPLLVRVWSLPDANGQGLGAFALKRGHRNYTIQGMIEYTTGYGVDRTQRTLAMDKLLADELRAVAPRWECSVIQAVALTREPTAEQLKQFESEV